MPDQDKGEVASEIQRLHARVIELERKLTLESASVKEMVGSPVKPPEHLDARFDQERIRSAVNAAFRETGFDGEVTAVDCTEYPCLLVGELKNSGFGRDEAERFAKAGALAAYGKDTHSSFGSSTTDKAGNVKNIFGIALYPKSTDDDQNQQAAKRLSYRFDQLRSVE